MPASQQDESRDLAIRLAGTCHARRLYAPGSATLVKNTEVLKVDVDNYFARFAPAAITFALLGDGMAVAGVPLVSPPPPVLRLIAQMKLREIEIISVRPQASLGELQSLIDLVTAELSEVPASQSATWLRERGVRAVEIKHLRLTGALGGTGSFRDVYRAGKDTLGREMRRARDEGVVEVGSVLELAAAILEVVLDGDGPVTTLVAFDDRDDFHTTHALSVGVLAACQAAALGLPVQEVRDICVAGLLHDIGKARVPEAIWQKRGALTPAELALVESHALEGARVLVRSHGIDRLDAIVAAEHHKSAAESTHLGSQLVALADAFDTVRTARPFEEREAMQGALAVLLGRNDRHFNPYLLGRFATLCGMYVVGDVVSLNSGELGRVISVHPESALHPVVEIIDPGQGRAPAGTIVDLSVLAASGVRLRSAMSSAFAALDPSELARLG
jgi:HD-GYP domain-containing protein (c-di-GMP phosphodiesterase class II)